MRRWLPPSALLLASVVVLTAFRLSPVEGEPVAVLFPPGTDADTALLRVAAAGGLPIRTGGWDGVIIARSADARFVAALYRAGALLVVSAAGAAGCT
jgi:hypothetical protein